MQSALLVKGNTKNKNIQELADHLVKDHAQTNYQLQSAAKKMQLIYPTTVTVGQKNDYQRLATLRNIDFDHEFLKQQITDHEKTINLFQQEAQHGRSKLFTTLSIQTLPTLRHHLALLQEAQKSLK